jgi:hypothetical protein
MHRTRNMKLAVSFTPAVKDQNISNIFYYTLEDCTLNYASTENGWISLCLIKLLFPICSFLFYANFVGQKNNSHILLKSLCNDVFLKALIVKRRGNVLAERPKLFYCRLHFPTIKARLPSLISQSFFSLCRMEADKSRSKECGYSILVRP